MDALSLHSKILDGYKEYIWSFIDIYDEDIRKEVETLPENDRTRYTISPTARKTLLTRLLTLNHQRAAEEKSITSAANTKAPNKTRESRPKRDDELI